jgi:O-antigen/teichoic acid export membrane protein
LVGLRRVRRPLAVALPSRRRTSEVVRFGLKEQLSWLADLVNFQTDKIIIALTVDIRAAAAYEIAVRVVLGVRSVAVLTVSAMIPTAAADIEERGSEVIHEFYERYLKRTVAIGFPIFLASCVSAPFLLVVWLGESPAYAQGVLIVLALAYAVNITTGVGSTVTIAAGNPGLVARNASLIAILNVALTLALAPTFGVAGVLAGTFLAVSIGSLLFVRSFHRLYGVPYAIYVSAVSGPAALAAAVALPPTALQFFAGAGEDRLEALILLVGSAGGYLAVYWIIASRLDWLPDRLRFRGLRRRTAGSSSGPEQERAGAP